jgi:hypothetical protein
VTDVDGRLVETQIRTELQHLWAVWSETLAAALDQSIKYGGGPVEIQQSLLLESEIIGVLESQERDAGAGREAPAIRPPSELKTYIDRLYGASLPPEALTAASRPDLTAFEHAVKERLTREILSLASKRQTP